MRAIHQQVLRSFATAGRPPSAADLAETARRYANTAEAVLTALHAEDFLQSAADGQIRAAYPFSAVPTLHLVDLDAKPRVYAMCAIDALGIAAMIQATVRITSACPPALANRQRGQGICGSALACCSLSGCTTHQAG